MLNRAARYFPILREIRRTVGINKDSRVLEVGSGSIGLGEFYPFQFVGSDVSFAGRPRVPMLAVKCSGSQLPFADCSFDAVVVSDVMEHVPPDCRGRVIQEALRVSRRLAVIGYPTGAAAYSADRKLREDYLRRKLLPPAWLDEHMLHPFPDSALFSKLPDGWSVRKLPNESLTFHYRMMRMEMYRPLNYLFCLALHAFPQMMERLLRRMDRNPSYRTIFVLCRR
jgi:SAM-dependent methyltransferase